MEPKQQICAGIPAPAEDYTDAPTVQLAFYYFVHVYFYVKKQISEPLAKQISKHRQLVKFVGFSFSFTR
jgi:hypothetical protein